MPAPRVFIGKSQREGRAAQRGEGEGAAGRGEGSGTDGAGQGGRKADRRIRDRRVVHRAERGRDISLCALCECVLLLLTVAAAACCFVYTRASPYEFVKRESGQTGEKARSDLKQI